MSSFLVLQNYCFSISISLSLFFFFLCTPSTSCFPSPPTTALPVHVILVRSFSYTRKIINYCILEIEKGKESVLFFCCFLFSFFAPYSVLSDRIWRELEHVLHKYYSMMNKQTSTIIRKIARKKNFSFVNAI